MKNSPDTFGKIFRLLAGFLVSGLIVAILLKIFSNLFWAIVLGTIANGGAAYYMLKKHPENKSLKWVAYGAIAGTVFVIVLALSLWAMIDAAFQGIAD